MGCPRLPATSPRSETMGANSRASFICRGQAAFASNTTHPRPSKSWRMEPRSPSATASSPGVSQTLARAARGAEPAPILHFVNLWETEAECEQSVLLAHLPGAGEAE